MVAGVGFFKTLLEGVRIECFKGIFSLGDNSFFKNFTHGVERTNGPKVVWIRFGFVRFLHWDCISIFSWSRKRLS